MLLCLYVILPTEYCGNESPLPLHMTADKAIHIDEFEAHVEAMHQSSNAQFGSQFKVGIFM